MRYKRSHLIGLFAALLVLVTILGGGILLVIKEDHASAGSTEGAAYHFREQINRRPRAAINTTQISTTSKL